MPEEAVVTEGAPAAPAPAAPAPAVTPAAPAADPFDDATVQTFDRSYVEKLRREAAEHRTAAKPYKEVFDAYDDADKEIWFDLAKSMAADPKVGAQKMLELAQGLLEAGNTEGANQVLDGIEGEPEYLTAAQLEAEFAKREKQAKLDAEVQNINSEAKELGYKENTPAWRDLMSRALHDHNYDLKAAHAAREAEKQAVIDSFVASKGQGPVVPAAAGAAPATGTVPKTMEEAREATRARLKAARAAAS